MADPPQRTRLRPSEIVVPPPCSEDVGRDVMVGLRRSRYVQVLRQGKRPARRAALTFVSRGLARACGPRQALSLYFFRKTIARRSAANYEVFHTLRVVALI